MKSSQGLEKFVNGCWTRPGTTSVYTKEKTIEWPWGSRSPKRHSLKAMLWYYMVHVFNIMWRIKNRSFNSTFCSDNALHLLWAYYNEDFKWRLHVQFGVAFRRVVLREVYYEAPNRVWRALKTSILNIAWKARVALHKLGSSDTKSPPPNPQTTNWQEMTSFYRSQNLKFRNQFMYPYALT